MKKDNHEPDLNLKGTLVSVFIVGIIIIVMWVAVYSMYMGR